MYVVIQEHNTSEILANGSFVNFPPALPFQSYSFPPPPPIYPPPPVPLTHLPDTMFLTEIEVAVSNRSLLHVLACQVKCD